MPWYQCPRCKSQDAFFQTEQNFENGIEVYKDHTGRTNFRNNLSVSDVDVAYCRKCMVVKMNAYPTAEEIRRRNIIRVLYGLGLLIFLIILFSDNQGTSNNASVTPAKNYSVDNSFSNQSIYVSDLNEDGSHEIDRIIMSNGVDDCGNSLPEEVFIIDPIIPSSWRLLEFNGCGSGSSYEWINSDNESEFIRYESHGDVGWCSDLSEDEVEAAVMNRVLGYGENFLQFSKVENSTAAQYRYLKTTSDGQYEVNGFIQVGPVAGLCGEGDFRVESNLINSEAELFEEIVNVIFLNS